MKFDLKSRRSRVVFLIVSIVFATWMGFELVDFIRLQRTRSALIAIDKANRERMRKGENFEAADAFVGALRAIDTDFTEEDFKAAFLAYVDGVAKGLVLAKAGKSTAVSDAKIQAALRRLIQVARKYE